MSFDRKSQDNKHHRNNDEKEAKVQKTMKAKRRNVNQELHCIDLDTMHEEDWLFEELYN